MGKYAANKKCGACVAIGSLCMGCAMEWREKHHAKEFRLLLRLEKAVRSRRSVAEIPYWEKRLDEHRRAKPRRLKAADMPSKDGAK